MAKGLSSLKKGQGGVHSQKSQFLKTCEWQIDFILSNKNVLIEEHKNGSKLVQKARSIRDCGYEWTGAQTSEINRIYEVVMEKLGYGGHKPLLRKGDFRKNG